MSDLSDAPEMPEWFYAELHRAGEGGIFERATGVLLGEDGEPFSAAVRLMRDETAALLDGLIDQTVKRIAAATEAAKPMKKPRNTQTVLADHMNTGAAAGEQE